MNIGIIGFGRIGNEHSQWIAQSGAGRVAAVFDPTPARRALAKSKGLRAVDEIDVILDDPSIPAVLISTPTSMHLTDTLRALRANKHVMVEKPVTLMFSEAQLVQEEAHKRKRIISVFHNRRWDIDYLTVRRAIENGIFGGVFNIESRLGQWASCVGPATKDWNPGWRNEASFGGGGLYDWGSHFVDQIWQLLQPARPLRVFAQLRGNVWTNDCDDLARICIDFDSGAVAMVEINTTTTRPLPRWHVDGEHGSADSPHSLAFDTNEWAKLSFAPAGRSQTHALETAPAGLSEADLWKQFLLACDGKGDPAVKLDSVLRTMLLLDAARQSSATGQAVIIDPRLWK